MITKKTCPVCNSSKFRKTKDLAKCLNCGYSWKSNQKIEVNNENN